MQNKIITDLSMGGLSYFIFGKDEKSFLVLLLLFTINMTLGLLKCFKNSDFKLSVLKESVIKFIAILLLLVTSSIVSKLDGAVLEELRKLNPYFFTFFIFYYSLSIIENAIEVGVPIPKLILNQIKGKFNDMNKWTFKGTKKHKKIKGL